MGERFIAQLNKDFQDAVEVQAEEPVNDTASTEALESEIDRFISSKRNMKTLWKTERDVKKMKKFLLENNEGRNLEDIPPTELDELIANFVINTKKADREERSLRSQH